MATGDFVAYYRVSTQAQGRSGLGLEAQENAVVTFLNGGRWTLRASYVEVESGKHSDRPELNRALQACKRYGARLVVAKLDRLSREASFILNLKAAGVRFVVADSPEMNDLTVTVLAAVAEHEGRAISERTKAALQAAKRRGVKLGGHPERLTAAARRRGAERSNARRGAAADEWASAFLDKLRELRAVDPCDGRMISLQAVADTFNAEGIPARRGGQWTPAQVSRLLERVRRLEQSNAERRSEHAA